MSAKPLDSQDWIEQYLCWFRDVRRKRPSSVDQYRKVLVAYSTFVSDPIVATTLDVEGFMYRKRRNRTGGLMEGSAATIIRDRAIVSSFYKYLQARGARTDNPCELTGAPTLYNRHPRAISDATWNTIWKSPRISNEDRVFFGLMGLCGLRRMELVQVSASHFDLQRGVLFLPNRKGGKEQPIEFHDLVCVVADNLPHLLGNSDEFLAPLGWMVKLRKRDEFLMPWMKAGVYTNIVNRVLTRLLTDVGLASDTFTPHALRHTAATNLARSGVALEVVADQMGHSDLATTRMYLRTSGQLRRWRKE